MANLTIARAKQDAEAEHTRILAEVTQKAQGLLAEAEQEATRTLTEARQEAEGEEARILAEASRRAEEITQKSVQDILHEANEKAFQVREDAHGNITNDVKKYYYQLVSTLQDLLATANGIRSEWALKAMEPWPMPEIPQEGKDDLLANLSTPSQHLDQAGADRDGHSE